MALDLHGLTAARCPDLPPLTVPLDEALALGAVGGPMDVSAEAPGIACADIQHIPAGWAFFGQFIAHDITNDRQPLQSHQEVGRNFRAPRLDLVSCAQPA